MITELSKPLSLDELEFRIGSVSAGKGFYLLAYKTARTDVKRLNEAVGMYWKNRFFYDDKGILSCSISIYDEKTNQWIDRIDVGTESSTEKEKGSYSDAFKRAGFKWGIGTELYDFPKIFIKWEEWDNKTPKYFSKDNIVIEKYSINEKKQVEELVLSYKGKTIFPQKNNLKENNKKVVKLATKEQVEKLKKIDNIPVMLTYLKVNKIEDISFDNALKIIERKGL